MNRTVSVLPVLLLLASAILSPAPNQAKDKNKKPVAAAPADLVWPLPPDPPRVRYLAMIRSADDVLGKNGKKMSFVERVSGKTPIREEFMLRKPYGVAVDKSGRILVADAEQRGILILDRNAKTVSLRKGNGQFPLFLPVGVAADDDGRMFVSDSFAGQVVVFGAQGTPVAAFGKGIFKRPGGIALNRANGRLYAADAKANQVLVFDTTTFKLVRTFGGTSKSGEYEAGTFSAPTNLALDSKGRVFVTDTFNCRIQVFNSEGKFLHMWGTPGTHPGSFVRPKGIAIDSQDHVYVVDAGFGNFQVFTPEGKPLMFVGGGGDEPGQFILPAGLAIDREDRIYVTEQRPTGSRLQVFQYLSRQSAPPADGKVK
ncbi:MAG: 6-bladed beta-propeller [Acidobacteria bacterium]|nr:6-bladed beta-propeller [Acidobacteriota bacterium]